MKTIVHTDKEHIEAVIQKCDVCFVGMVNSDSSPYVIPMNFGYRDGIIYLHSAPEGKHTSILEQNPNVCITFCTERKLIYQHPDVACSYSMCANSVLAHGEVEFIEDMNEKTEILNVIMKQYSDKTFTYSDPAVKNVKVWRVNPHSVTCKEFGVSAKR